jgi:hypothetical protein
LAIVLGLGGNASTLVRGFVESKVGMGCGTTSGSGAAAAADGSSGGSTKSVVPSSAFESVMLEGLPRAETAKSSSNSSP